uniref:hypothetical protein n=1 Tax=Gloeochaete wittrockiana TaxID=38269 RepID=UPI00051A9832|nr:hypothetical protein [Gloeochaete wittrockiana]
MLNYLIKRLSNFYCKIHSLINQYYIHLFIFSFLFLAISKLLVFFEIKNNYLRTVIFYLFIGIGDV